MTAKEIRTIQQESQRAFGKVTVSKVPEKISALKITLPMKSASGGDIYFFAIKRPSARRFSLILHVESIGILPIDTTLSMLQEILKEYGLLLSQDAIIMEENIAIPLSNRIRSMGQALIGIDGIRRLWRVEHNRRVHAESEDLESIGDGANNSSPK